MFKALKAKSVLAAAVLAAFLLAPAPAPPARAGTAEDANQFLRKTLALDFDYFVSENKAGKPLREIALSGEAGEDWPMLAWGDAHGDKKTDAKGGAQYRYVGYNEFDEDVTNPFFPPDETGRKRLDQHNWIVHPWSDSRTKHLIRDEGFDDKDIPWLTERLRWGLFWAAKCNGFDPPATTSDLYKNPQEYVHIILPPAEGTWGMGRMWHRTVDLVRLRLYDLIEELPVEPAPIKRPSLVGLGRSREDVIQFRIPDVPPLYGAVKREGQKDISGQWVSRLILLAEKAEVKPRFRRAYVFIRVAAHERWDPDNRNLKPILDGLRKAGIIETDDWKNVELYVKAVPLKPGEYPYTDIIVCSAELPPPLPPVVQELLSDTP